MPELPEIEHLKRSLEPVLLGARVVRAALARRDVLERERGQPGRLGEALLAGGTIVSLRRHGKQLAIITDDGRALCVHLGMSGQLRHVPPRAWPPRSDHVHCQWWIANGPPLGRLLFRDPRRFGGLWSFASVDALHQSRWSVLGPDALTIDRATFAERLSRTQRAIKPALLDQSLIAGLGNIYVDEALHQAGAHPRLIASSLSALTIRRLHRAVQVVLRQAIDAGGSTLRDYVDASGAAGAFVQAHRVYGRGGMPCLRCGDALLHALIAQRTSVWCARCQPLDASHA